jgi:hypothetical protein
MVRALCADDGRRDDSYGPDELDDPDDEPDELEQLIALGPLAGSAPLAALFAKGLYWLAGRAPEPVAGSLPWDNVNLIHASDLDGWTRFPRCQDVAGLSYGEYRIAARQLTRVRKKVASLMRAERKLRRLDTDDIVVYHTEYCAVGRAIWPHRVRVDLKHVRASGTWLESDDDVAITMTSHGDWLRARAGWTRKVVRVRSLGPSRLAHAAEIASLHDELKAVTDEQRDQITEVRTSRFAHPVLFVSHRWESEEHPDPTGQQLQRLRMLKNCWLIYDYTSFPQLPRTAEEEIQFNQILDSMHELIQNVVVLDAPDYLSRGWLVFEYLMASLSNTVVCDEVNDSRFAELRDWVATEAPFATNPWRDSWESRLSNYRNQRLLSVVNRLLPVYAQAGFRTEHDASKVTELLGERLKTVLPPRKEHQEYLHEWTVTRWTDDDLAKAFRGEIDIPNDITMAIRPFATRVPTRLADAVHARYRVNSMTLVDRANPMESLGRLDWQPAVKRDRR